LRQFGSSDSPKGCSPLARTLGFGSEPAPVAFIPSEAKDQSLDNHY